MIITIGRQYGSGGREIGEKLAKRLDYAYYDTMILEKTAKESGISRELIMRYDEQLRDKWMAGLASGSGTGSADHLPLALRVVLAQFEVIRKIGQSGSAVIVGRCADYVLRERKDVLSVFIHADRERRADRVSARNQISLEEAKKRIKNTDKHRAAYYNCYTEKIWGSAESYHLCIDSGRFGIDGAVDYLETCIRQLRQV
ncbi:hypothetical protein BRYFOR_09640 [Marvinbryantia formatexigens DSM 14469]|uniref:Cytidylate kinase n=1 Tax=Marvinbryantia formatexigens DSM 14469 TaxID=478749 RepID=C6LLU2_9FIRM|nr:cytidylate kinase-like family protein [Marvinbryantia formatexigens]EET58411.1 hypothetical protein BRYFOR_09640 [Marvinbryantia formatexigens DSM 14469]UWO26367.1 cytidylate kinase-like family protein [Marvinbryantia formatexigens DSM 14469]SDH24542.1 Cytidylate kinase [Marvinbryantia formatexigens]